MDDYIGALQRLRPHRIRLIELAWKFLKPDGMLDEDQMAFEIKDIQEAANEAQAYSEDTRKAITLLCQLPRLEH
jgi:hypothetical protein